MSAATLPAPRAVAGAAAASQREDSAGRLRRLALFAAALLVILVYPIVDHVLNWQSVRAVIPIMLFVLLALGLNIVVGYAGLLDLGYAAFFAIGAYSTAFLTSPVSPLKFAADSPWRFLQDFWVSMVIAVIMAAIFGVILGAPTLRLRGDYLAIVTLGFGEIVPRVVLNLEQWTQGSKGMNPIGRPHLLGCQFGLDPCVIAGQTFRLGAFPWYYLIAIVGILSVVAITRLRDSRLGRAWAAIRDDEIAAVSMGINPVTTKLLAFALGASFSGFAGAIYSAYLQFIDPGQFDFSISVLVLCMVILGGTGNVYGVMLGGLIISSFDRILAERITNWIHALGAVVGPNIGFAFKQALPWGTPLDVTFNLQTALKAVNLMNLRLMFFGLCLVLLMVMRPQGLLPARRRRWATADDAADEAAARDEAGRDGPPGREGQPGAAAAAAAPTYLQVQTAGSAGRGSVDGAAAAGGAAAEPAAGQKLEPGP